MKKTVKSVQKATEVAKKATEKVVAKTAKQIDDEIIEVGKRTVIDLGIHGLHPELINETLKHT